MEGGIVRRYIVRTCVVVFLCALVVGCGSSNKIKARGRVTKDGKPFAITKADNMGLRIVLAPIDLPSDATTYTQYPAMFQTDGTFQVKGNDGEGLPPGKYRVSMELIQKKEDLWKGKLLGGRSSFVVEVTPANKELVINLDEAHLD